MIASRSNLDARVAAIMFFALFGFMLSVALPVLKFPAIAQESDGTGIRVWRGTSQDTDFGDAVAEEDEVAAEDEVATEEVESDATVPSTRGTFSLRWMLAYIAGARSARQSE